MRIRNLLGLLLAPLLSACDDGTKITRLHSEHLMSKDTLTSMGLRGLPVEVHGLPFPNSTPADVVATLKFPPGFSKGLSFRLIEPGTWDRHTNNRLVLIFNGKEHPNAPWDCKLKEAAPTHPPSSSGGFSVWAVFCKGDNGYFGSGHLEASRVQPGDWTEYTRVMRNLLYHMVEDARHQNERD